MAAMIRECAGTQLRRSLELQWVISIMAIRKWRRRFDFARELDHIPTVIHALWCAAELCQVRREPQKVEEFTEVLLPLLSQHGSAVSLANVAMLRGWAKVMGGQCEDGIREVQDGLTAW